MGHETLTVGVFGGHQFERVFNRVLILAQDDKIYQLVALQTDIICDPKIPIPEPSVKKLLGQLKMVDTTNDEQLGDIDLLISSEHYWDLGTGKTRSSEKKESKR